MKICHCNRERFEYIRKFYRGDKSKLRVNKLGIATFYQYSRNLSAKKINNNNNKLRLAKHIQGGQYMKNREVNIFKNLLIVPQINEVCRREASYQQLCLAHYISLKYPVEFFTYQNVALSHPLIYGTIFKIEFIMLPYELSYTHSRKLSRVLSALPNLRPFILQVTTKAALY